MSELYVFKNMTENILETLLNSEVQIIFASITYKITNIFKILITMFFNAVDNYSLSSVMKNILNWDTNPIWSLKYL